MSILSEEIPEDVTKTIDRLMYEAIAANADVSTEQMMVKAILAERDRCAAVAAAEVMKFRSKVGGRYYPGYHEDMREAVKNAVSTSRKGGAA